MNEVEDFFFVGSKKISFKDNKIILVQGFQGIKDLILEKNNLWTISSVFLVELLDKSYLNFQDIQKIISQIPNLDASRDELKQNFMQISKVFKNTGSIISKMNEVFEVQNKLNLFIKLLNIYFKKQNLLEEKNWAIYIEKKSQESSKLNRIDTLTNKISDLEIKIKSEEPDYQFLKKRIEDLTAEELSLKKQAITNNKIYIGKTREYNNIRRSMDELNETLEVYNQKIEEFKTKTNKIENLKQNEEYLRVSKKKNDKKSQLDELSQKKSELSYELKELKEKILRIKQKSSELNSNVSKIKPKFKISEDLYSELTEQLESSRNQLDQIKNDLLQMEHKGSDEISSIEKPNGDRPQIIRYSKIIESEIVEANNLITHICNNLKLDIDNLNDNIILQSFQDIEKQFKLLISSDISVDFDSVKLIDFVKIIQIKLEEFKKCFNSLLAPIGMICKISPIPVFLQMENLRSDILADQESKEKTNDAIENFGYNFSFFNREKKEIYFENQKKQTKLFILLMCIAAINTIFGVSDNYFFEDDIDPKLMNKGTLKKILTILYENSIRNSKQIKNKYVFITKKLKFEKNEFQNLENLNIVNLSDIS